MVVVQSTKRIEKVQEKKIIIFRSEQMDGRNN